MEQARKALERSVRMQKESWMQPALQTSEAVLLPALERQSMSLPRFGNRYLPSAPADTFRPVTERWETEQPLALSTYVRPRGSMAGRSVLRAAGVRTTPVWQRSALRTGRRTNALCGRSRRFR